MKKRAIFALCAVLCAGMFNGVVMQVMAQVEGSSGEVQIPEAGIEGRNEQMPETGESSLESEVPPLSSPSGEFKEHDQNRSTPKEEEAPALEGESGDNHWESYGDMQDIVSAMEEAYSSLGEQIEYISTLLNMEDGYTLDEGEDNFFEALALYAIRHGETENYPYEIKITSENDFNELQSIYWSLNTVNGAKTEENSVICVSRLSAADIFSLSGMEQDAFETLISEDNREKVAELLEY